MRKRFWRSRRFSGRPFVVWVKGGPGHRRSPARPPHTQKGAIAVQFMMLVIPKGYERAEPSQMPSADAIAEMMK
jgi:hypothetical protein